MLGDGHQHECALSGADEKYKRFKTSPTHLAAVGVGSSVGHREDTLARVLEREVLVLELLAVDRLAASACSGTRTASETDCRHLGCCDRGRVSEANIIQASTRLIHEGTCMDENASKKDVESGRLRRRVTGYGGGHWTTSNAHFPQEWTKKETQETQSSYRCLP